MILQAAMALTAITLLCLVTDTLPRILCALLLAGLAGEMLWEVRETRRRRRDLARLHEELAGFARDKRPVSFSVEDTDLAMIQDDLARLSQSVILSEQNNAHHRLLLRDLLADICHQFKTPLAALKLNCELQLCEAPCDRARRQLELTERMENMIQAMLRLEKLQAGGYELHYAPCDMAGVVRGIVAELSPLYPEKGWNLSLPETLLRFDESWMHEALLNVIKNACEHTAPTGLICVKCVLQDAFVWITVEDDGGGLPEAELAHLFQRFRQMDAHLPVASSGTGLGLAIAKAVLQRHHGDISAQNGTSGMRFTLYLPVLQESFFQAS